MGVLPDPGLAFPAVFANRVATSPHQAALCEVTFQGSELLATPYTFRDLDTLVRYAASASPKPGSPPAIAWPCAWRARRHSCLSSSRRTRSAPSRCRCLRVPTSARTPVSTSGLAPLSSIASLGWSWTIRVKRPTCHGRARPLGDGCSTRARGAPAPTERPSHPWCSIAHLARRVHSVHLRQHRRSEGRHRDSRQSCREHACERGGRGTGSGPSLGFPAAALS